MEDLRSQVESCQSRIDVGSTVEVNYYTSGIGQHYAILVTKVLWYKVRLFVEFEYPNYTMSELLSPPGFYTWIEVQEEIERINNFFKNPDFTVARHITKQYQVQLYVVRLIPTDCTSNPDKYINRGDIIATRFHSAASHAAIYLGNGKVGHISGHGGGKADSVARIGTLIGNFVSKEADDIRIVEVSVRIRKKEEIAKKAEELAASKFREGDYNILRRNCQHFAFLCATGVEFAIDV